MSDDRLPRSFGAFLADLQGGQLHRELTDVLSEAVAEMHNVRMEEGGKPKTRIAITVDLVLDGDVIEARGDFKAKLPEVKRRKDVFFATPENGLTRRNPRQQELPLRSVPTEPGATRAI